MFQKNLALPSLRVNLTGVFIIKTILIIVSKKVLLKGVC
jgi:hypothetical protein